MTLALRLADLMDQALAQGGLTRARAGVIWELHRRGPLFQRQLSQALGVTPRNVTGLVDAVEAAGLVVRCPHPTDRRTTLVKLTARGRSATTAMETGRDSLAAELFRHVSSPDMRRFVDVLDQLLRVANPPSPPTHIPE